VKLAGVVAGSHNDPATMTTPTFCTLSTELECGHYNRDDQEYISSIRSSLRCCSCRRRSHCQSWLSNDPTTGITTKLYIPPAVLECGGGHENYQRFPSSIRLSP